MSDEHPESGAELKFFAQVDEKVEVQVFAPDGLLAIGRIEHAAMIGLFLCYQHIILSAALIPPISVPDDFGQLLGRYRVFFPRQHQMSGCFG